MRIRCLEHVAFEGPGNIAAWARARGHEFLRTRLYAGEPLPDPAEFALLVVMGGPMSVHDEADFPWLAAEKEWLKQVIARGRSVLGVCLGAQLLAEALGAPVMPNEHKEIGWHPVEMSPWGAASRAFIGIPPNFWAFHWHGDTFGVPRGAVAAAASAACADQAFALGAKLVGVQFHFESTRESIDALIENSAADLTPGDYVQSVEQIRAGADEHLVKLEAMLFRLLDNMAKEI